jgi:steroid delta-isomerase-like uncharacterized protein
MSVEANKQVLQRFTTEFINTANANVAAELISPNAVFHVPGRPPLLGVAGYLQIVGMMRSGFSDIQWTLAEVVAEADTVACRFSMTGTHDGTFFGVPPSGKNIKITTMGFYRLEDGKIVEEHGLPDMLGILTQIGALPANPS